LQLDLDWRLEVVEAERSSASRPSASGLCHDIADPNGGATVREMKEGSRIDVGADVEKGLEIAAVSQYFGNRRLG
jgi:hypothetical protein